MQVKEKIWFVRKMEQRAENTSHCSPQLYANYLTGGECYQHSWHPPFAR